MENTSLSCPSCGKTFNFWFLKPRFNCKKCDEKLYTNIRIVIVVLVIVISLILMLLNIYIFYGSVIGLIVGIPIVLLIANYIGNRITKIESIK